MDLLSLAGRKAKWVLALGLVVAVLWPQAARVLSDWLVPLIMTIMFAGALRLRPSQWNSITEHLTSSLVAVLTLQLALPVAVASAFWVTGLLGHPAAAAVVIALSASGIVSSPNIAAIMGLDSVAAMRFFALGTALVPVTCLPPLLILFGAVDAAGVLQAAGRLALILIVSGGAGMLVRKYLLGRIGPVGEERLDGLSAIALGVFVIALMPAFTETALSDPAVLLGWLALSFALNFGLQIAVYRLAGQNWAPRAAGSLALISGNRNMALFFAALPTALTAPLLPFLAAYQVPMYLTPLLLGWLYGHAKSATNR